MASQFASYSWQNAGVFSVPTLVKRAPVRFLMGSARRGNLIGRGGAVRTLLRNLAIEEKQDEEEE